MKKSIIILLIFVSIFLVGCDDIGQVIMMDILGPFAIFSGGNDKKDVKPTDTAQLSENTTCGSNEFYNGVNCDCVDGYFMQNGKCVLESSKECVFDSDCAPNGAVSICKDKYTKQVYRCDLRTNKCVNGKFRVAETIDCRDDFGKNAVCQAGSCLSYNPYNPVAK